MPSKRPISFKHIRTREQLLTRIVNGELSLGTHGRYIWPLLSLVQDSEHTLPVMVSWSAQYGKKTQKFYL